MTGEDLQTVDGATRKAADEQVAVSANENLVSGGSIPSVTAGSKQRAPSTKPFDREAYMKEYMKTYRRKPRPVICPKCKHEFLIAKPKKEPDRK